MFSKYKKLSAYHWDDISRNVRRHNAYTACRYAVILDVAGIKAGDAVLDLGCGDGALTFLAWKQAEGGRVVGVEPEPTGRSLAQKMLAEHGAKVPIFAWSDEIASESQDVVLSADVIEHVPDPRALLIEMHRLLKPGGRLVLSTPVRLTEHPYDKEHVHEFFPVELCQMVSECLTVLSHQQFCPVFVLELYYWCPWFLLRRGVIRVFINMLSAWFGLQVMRSMTPLQRYWTLQVIAASKE